jgi:hypothetical protein
VTKQKHEIGHGLPQMGRNTDGFAGEISPLWPDQGAKGA